MQQAKQSGTVKWDSFLEIPEKNRSKGENDQLRSDVKDAYGVIFKTEPLETKD